MFPGKFTGGDGNMNPVNRNRFRLVRAPPPNSSASINKSDSIKSIPGPPSARSFPTPSQQIQANTTNRGFQSRFKLVNNSTAGIIKVALPAVTDAATSNAQQAGRPVALLSPRKQSSEASISATVVKKIVTRYGLRKVGVSSSLPVKYRTLSRHPGLPCPCPKFLLLGACPLPAGTCQFDHVNYGPSLNQYYIKASKRQTPFNKLITKKKEGAASFKLKYSPTKKAKKMSRPMYAKQIFSSPEMKLKQGETRRNADESMFSVVAKTRENRQKKRSDALKKSQPAFIPLKKQ